MSKLTPSTPLAGKKKPSVPGKKTREKAERFSRLASYDVVEDLEKAANLILSAMRKGYKPKKLAPFLGRHFKTNFKKLNPLVDVDNYGMEQILAKLATQDELTRVKTFYKATVDAFIKSQSGFGVPKIKRKKKYLAEEVDEIVLLQSILSEELYLES